MIFTVAILLACNGSAWASKGGGVKTLTNASDQERLSVSGVVTDSSGQPLVGVVVFITGSAISTITNNDGQYSLKFTNPNSEIETSYVGYKTVKKLIGTSSMLNIQLEESSLIVEKVVVVAHGSQKKESVVGAITSVDLSNIKLPSSNLSTALGGQLAGVVTVQSSGEPGSGADFYIRGISTFGSSNTPLVLVDGIERSLDLVDVDDIESFSILKDASATAVYGVRGANGVIVVNTKKGKEGRPSITLKYEHGILAPTAMPDLANGTDFANLYNQTTNSDFFSQTALDQYAMDPNDPRRDHNVYPNVDWMDALFNDIATNQRVNASVSGGGEIARYYVSGSYYHEGSIFKNNDMSLYDSAISYDKINFRANVDVDLTATTTMSFNLSNVFETKVSPGGGTSDVWSSAFNASPLIYPAYYTDKDGDWLAWSGMQGEFNNPYNELVNTGYAELYKNATQASVNLTQKFGDAIPGLIFKLTYSWDAKNYNTVTRTKSVDRYWLDPSGTHYNEDGSLNLQQVHVGDVDLGYATARGTNQNMQSSYLESSLNYSNKSEKGHNISALFLYNHKVQTYVGATEKYKAMPYKNQGIAGRVTYNYKNRYFAEVNVGYNGSENFSPGYRFGLFPAVAAGWVVTNEKFMESVDASAISLIKIRGSYGKVGNDNIGGNRRFVYNATINQGAGSYPGIGDTGGNYGGSGVAIGDEASLNVGWEEATKSNIGIDLGFMNNSLNVTAEVFHEYREGIFMERTSLPGITGIEKAPYSNIGKVKNSGFEASFDYTKKLGEVTVTARGNVSFSRNILIDKDIPTQPHEYLNMEGKSLNQPMGLISEGLFADQNDIDTSPLHTFSVVRPGDIKYRDINGDGKIDANDKVAIGYSGTPEVMYGFGATAYYKGFSVNLFFQGATNSSLFLSGASMHPFQTLDEQRQSFNQNVIGNIWLDGINEDVNAIYPKATLGVNSNNTQQSTHWMRDRSYLRLKSAEISYDLPKKVLSKLQLQKFTIYTQGMNLLTFSGFKLWDPEQGGGTGARYPLNRSVNLGVRITY